MINQAESLLLFKGCFVEIYIQRHLTFVQNLCNKLNLKSQKIIKNTFYSEEVDLLAIMNQFIMNYASKPKTLQER